MPALAMRAPWGETSWAGSWIVAFVLIAAAGAMMMRSPAAAAQGCVTDDDGSPVPGAAAPMGYNVSDLESPCPGGALGGFSSEESPVPGGSAPAEDSPVPGAKRQCRARVQQPTRCELPLIHKVWWARVSNAFYNMGSRTPHMDAAQITTGLKNLPQFADSIRKWVGKLPVMEGKLQECRGSLRRLLRCVPTPTPARFPKAEEQLYSEFSARRKMGLPVGELWFVNKMKRFVKFWYPDASFEASHGWFQNFCARHNLVSRRKKNSKMESVEQRIGLIQRFHAAVQRDVLPTTPSNGHLLQLQIRPRQQQPDCRSSCRSAALLKNHPASARIRGV
jgi:hypothetical protein